VPADGVVRVGVDVETLRARINLDMKKFHRT
jgi:hypothetical protein